MAPRKTLVRIVDLEIEATQRDAAAALVVAAQGSRTRGDIADLLLELLAAKLEASRAIADGARAAMSNPAWLARQDAAGVAALGQWLDSSALDLGDRLAHRGQGQNGE